MAEDLKDQGREEGLAKGEAEGLAKDLLRLLEARGISVDGSSRRHI